MKIEMNLPRWRPRRVGVRMGCRGCDIAWVGGLKSECFNCNQVGECGFVPSIYPSSMLERTV